MLAHAFLVLSGLIFPGEYLLGITPALAASQESDAQNEKRLIDGAKKEGKLAFWINGWNANELEQLFSKFRQNIRLSLLNTGALPRTRSSIKRCCRKREREFKTSISRRARSIL